MPGKRGAPALRRVTRLSLSSCLTDLLVYPLARSSPTVLGLVTRTLCREASDLSIAGLARRQEVAEQKHAELDEEELVPRRHRLQRLARIGDLVGQDGGERALGQAHSTHHELRGNLAARPVLSMAVGERHGQAVVDETVSDGDLRRLAEPAPETVAAPLDARAIRGAVLGEEELRRVGELEEVLVEGGGECRLVLEDEERGAPDALHVLLVELHEGHLLAHEALHVRAGMRALHPCHCLSSLWDNFPPWRAYPQPWACAGALFSSWPCSSSTSRTPPPRPVHGSTPRWLAGTRRAPLYRRPRRPRAPRRAIRAARASCASQRRRRSVRWWRPAGRSMAPRGSRAARPCSWPMLRWMGCAGPGTIRPSSS